MTTTSRRVPAAAQPPQPDESPTPGLPSRRRWGLLGLDLAEGYALVGLTVVLVVVFSSISSTAETFPTSANLQVILGNQSVLLLAALAVLFPIVTNVWDFTVGAVLGLATIVAAKVGASTGSIPLAIGAAVGVGLLIGLANGVLVTRAKINSVIATFGMTTLVAGARVLLGDIVDDEGQRHADELRARGGEVEYVHLDVADADDWAAAVALAEERLGKLDVLLNNAGIVAFAGAADLEEREWERILAVNQTGVALGLRAAIPALRRAGGGSIVNTASNLGLVGVPGYFAYQASKGAVMAMTKAAAIDYAGDGIRVNSVCPGLVITSMTEGEPPEAVQAIIDATPLGRAGQPEDIAAAALFLASDESAFVTGIDLVVDGGYLAQ